MVIYFKNYFVRFICDTYSTIVELSEIRFFVIFVKTKSSLNMFILKSETSVVYMYIGKKAKDENNIYLCNIIY